MTVNISDTCCQLQLFKPANIASRGGQALGLQDAGRRTERPQLAGVVGLDDGQTSHGSRDIAQLGTFSVVTVQKQRNKAQDTRSQSLKKRNRKHGHVLHYVLMHNTPAATAHEWHKPEKGNMGCSSTSHTSSLKLNKRTHSDTKSMRKPIKCKI